MILASSITSKLSMDETVVVPMNAIITKGNKPILVSYFPYRKVSYDRSPFKYYSDLNTALGSIYLNADLKKNINILFMTPSYEAYKYFADRNYRQISDQNIIIIYYKYRRDIEYTLITGKDFLKEIIVDSVHNYFVISLTNSIIFSLASFASSKQLALDKIYAFSLGSVPLGLITNEPFSK